MNGAWDDPMMLEKEWFSSITMTTWSGGVMPKTLGARAGACTGCSVIAARPAARCAVSRLENVQHTTAINNNLVKNLCSLVLSIFLFLLIEFDHCRILDLVHSRLLKLTTISAGC
jgi:hypothetical protein